MKASLAQIESKFGNKKANVEKILKYVGQAKEEGAELVVFPELSITGYPQNFSIANIQRQSAPIPGPIIDLLQRKAENLAIEIIVGLAEIDDGRIFDTAVLVKDDKLVRYRKTHVHWKEPFTAGDELGLYNSVLGKLGILICFDASFSEPTRILALQGAKTIVIPSAVPREFRRYAERRMIARALDNQVYVLYCNACGEGLAGNSMIVDPQGEIIAKAGDGEGLIFGTLSYDGLNRWRKEERIFPARRPELYGKIIDPRGEI